MLSVKPLPVVLSLTQHNCFLTTVVFLYVCSYFLSHLLQLPSTISISSFHSNQISHSQLIKFKPKMSLFSPPTHSPLLLNTKTNLSSSSSPSSPSYLLPLLTFSSKRFSSLTLFASSSKFTITVFFFLHVIQFWRKKHFFNHFLCFTIMGILCFFYCLQNQEMGWRRKIKKSYLNGMVMILTLMSTFLNHLQRFFIFLCL